MRAPFLALLTVLAVNVVIDLYIYVQASRRCHNKSWGRVQLYSAIFLMAAMAVEICLPARRGGELQLLCKMWLLFAYLSIYLPKYIAVLFDWLASIPRLWRGRRIKILTKLGTAAAIVTCAAMWWGALVNRFNIQVKNIDVEVPALPHSMDGTTIVQFSDLHTGTYGNDTTYVSRLVDAINALDADAIVFTGDIVNRRSEEILPFLPALSRLQAPMGVYAILGNHDYGDYQNWQSPADKEANMDALYNAYDSTGIRLLRNETVWLRNSGNDSIALIGVENIGDPPFKTYGSLRTAYPTPQDSVPKILLSHNPQHWADSISGKPGINIPLTLSGHTHAMQIEVSGISPASMRYPTWGGLYADNDGSHKLYVNIGAGTVGLPMRLGATPEITLITLRKTLENHD